MKLKVTYVVMVRRKGTGNAWVNWSPPMPTLADAVRVLEDALNYHADVRVRRTTAVVEPGEAVA